MSGRSPPLYCTLILITMHSHQPSEFVTLHLGSNGCVPATPNTGRLPQPSFLHSLPLTLTIPAGAYCAQYSAVFVLAITNDECMPQPSILHFLFLRLTILPGACFTQYSPVFIPATPTRRLKRIRAAVTAPRNQTRALDPRIFRVPKARFQIYGCNRPGGSVGNLETFGHEFESRCRHTNWDFFSQIKKKNNQKNIPNK